ncbi:MAG: hypothetical protein WCJ31_22225, partial [Planctomycetia bacterium]
GDDDDDEEEEAPQKPARISRREKRLTKNDLKLVLENVGLLASPAASPEKKKPKHRTTVYKDSDESGACSSDDGFIETESSEDEEDSSSSSGEQTPAAAPKPPVPSVAPKPAVPPIAPKTLVPPIEPKTPVPPNASVLPAMTPDQLSDFAGFYSCDPAEEENPFIPPPVLFAPPPAPVKPPGPVASRHSYITPGPLAPAVRDVCQPASRKKLPMGPQGRVKPTPESRSVAPLFNKGHKPLPPPPTKKEADAKKKRAGGFGDMPQDGVYIRNGQLFYRDKDGKETPRSWNP